MRKVLLPFLLVLAGTARADQRLTTHDLSEIRAAIHRQMDACAVDRPAGIVFLDLLSIWPDAVQQVRITDDSGRAWLALYAMQRQRDGSWRANGCRLVRPRTIPT